MTYSTAFNTAINRVLGHEGGYVNDPNDPGGETNWGISKRSYPNVNIRKLTRDAAIAIYYRDFWLPIGGDRLKYAIAYPCLDAAVNHGIGTTRRMMQRALKVADDGIIGPVTLSKLATVDINDFVMRFVAERLDFYTRLSNWKYYGAGWTRRMAGVLRYGAEDN